VSETLDGRSSPAVRYELAITADEARLGVTKKLVRNGKHLEVSVPAGVISGSGVQLTNALQVTDSSAGDILINIVVKTPDTAQVDSDEEGLIDVNDDNFDKEVLAARLPVVVDFWAPWCGPCRMMAPIIGETAEQYRGKFKFCKLNVDENQATARRYRAMSIPLLVFFKNGQVVDQSLGAIPASQLRSKLDALL